ncbi:GNAT family N-acetyltransferase [Stenotrophomonas sp. S48]|uniref:GNAT family N-acetyltransferase n=1 Tax=unclassified Stenotrophomonas TaxID=196198 RepID=UPI0019023555|nr:MULTISPECIES: GNAT family N-acetyltransferase [unclassified Stenotrophomonas]MBK0025335.1 GNAT family N-acetyltransferase [Stenotrophomonas sp. S48]MBK0047281.1 GNAT family N-acetyltransferase [Stenotrophomonas sp. S49]
MSIFDLRIETERLILRPPQAQDLQPYLAFCADEEVMRSLGGVQPPSVAWRSFCSLAGAWQLFGYSMFSVIEKASGEWVGRMGPWQPLGWPGPEVGWSIRRASWGQGYAPEAAVAAIDWAFATQDWQEVIHTIAEDNEKSRAVARKLGSQLLRMGQLPPPYQGPPLQIWGQSRAQWQQRPR